MLGFLYFVFVFLVIVAAIAIVIIGTKWLLGTAGVQIPPPLLAIIGILAFIILLFAAWHFIGAMDFPALPRR